MRYMGKHAYKRVGGEGLHFSFAVAKVFNLQANTFPELLYREYFFSIKMHKSQLQGSFLPLMLGHYCH